MSPFLQEIIDNPDSEAPRRIYADWLEEQGEPLGEFIRLQCDMEETPEDDPRHPAMVRRQSALLREHRREWLKDVKGVPPQKVRFRRGFPDNVQTDMKTLKQSGDYWLRVYPIQGLQLIAEADLAWLAQWTGLRALRSLEFRPRLRDWGHSQQKQRLRLWKHPNLSNLHVLRLPDIRLETPEIEAIRQAPVAQSLREFHSEQWWPSLTEINTCWAAAAEKWPHLERLSIKLGKSLATWPEAFNPLLARLESLAVQDAPLNLLSYQQWGTLPPAARLHTLHFQEVPFDEERLTFCLMAPPLDGLRRLRLDGCGLEGSTLKALAQSPRTPQLTTLLLDNNDFDAAAARDFLELAPLDHLARLRVLNFRGKRGVFSDEQTARLFKIAAPKLFRLELVECGLTQRTLEALDRSPLREQLAWVDLRRNRLAYNAGEFLLQMEIWPRLERIDVRLNQFSLKQRRRLSEKFGDRILVD